MFANLRQDAQRLRSAYPRGFPWYLIEALLLDNGFQAVVSYRLASWCKRHRLPLLGPLFARLGLLFTGADISANAKIGPGLRISHGTGLVIGGFARIGAGALLLHQVTIGSPSEGRVEEMPEVGDRAFIGAGAKLIGAIRIGDDVLVGPNAVVTRDVEAASKVLTTAEITVSPRTLSPSPSAPATPAPDDA